MKLIDHKDHKWLSRFRRINGALTYSEDLVKFQIPKWKKVLGKDDIISTCPKFTDVHVDGHYNTAIQYLHSYPYNNPLARISELLWNKPFKAERIIFITAYKAFEKELRAAGFNAVYIPMTIDVKAVAKYKQEKVYKDRILYFGNIIQNKVALYNRIKRTCGSHKLAFDTLSLSRFNKGKELTREEVLNVVGQYEYAIAVGRCAQECHALGVKTLITGQRFGGLITSEDDYHEQLKTNMNGRIWTFSKSLPECLENMDKSIIKTTDIRSLNHAIIVQEEYDLK